MKLFSRICLIGCIFSYLKFSPKYLISLSLILFLTSCGLLKDRKVDKTKEKIRLVDRSVITEKSPGDEVTVFLPYPLPNPDRPKGEVRTYPGTNGATVGVEFDTLGVVRRIDADCPEVDKVEQRNLELDYGLKTKEVESKANIELANTIGKWTAITLIPIGFFFAVAFYFKN